MILYLAFSILFGVRLNDWNDEVSGQCYNSARTALLDSKHPYVDHIYLAITSLYVYAFFFAATTYLRIPRLPVDFQGAILFYGLLKFILHVYMVTSVHIANQGLLDNASLEQQWGFGQILPLIMAGSTVVECAKSLEGRIPSEDYHCCCRNVQMLISE